MSYFKKKKNQQLKILMCSKTIVMHNITCKSLRVFNLPSFFLQKHNSLPYHYLHQTRLYIKYKECKIQHKLR